MKVILPLILSLVLSISCSNSSELEVANEADQIIKAAIQASGNNAYESSLVTFKFRDKKYAGKRVGGDFDLRRKFQDSLGMIEDIYTNESFNRLIDDKGVETPDTMASKYEQSINSVFYFALLPYKLDDPAVRTEYLGQVTVKGKEYLKIKIGFGEEGGGQDHDDNFIYWINKDNNFIDYLAYEYANNGGGKRFREIYNERIIEGIRFTDAINFKPIKKGSVKLEDFDSAYANDELVELSRIVLENVEVKLLPREMK